MSAKPRKRMPISRFIAPLATLMILGYFGFHAFNGQYGIRAHIAMKLKTEVLDADLAQLTVQREKLESRIALLREGSMEKDMVDEQARLQLNMVRGDEVVILQPNR